jgi:hypothetical protein
MDQLIETLKQNGFDTYFFENNNLVIQKIFELIPKGSEVMTMSSVTLDTLGVGDIFNNSGKYNAIRPKLYAKEKDAAYHANAPEYVIGSVQAITEDGQIVMASATGSQLPAYVYGAKNVILVVGIQKIVKNLDEALKRINHVVLPLEDIRALKAYGVHSSVNKILIINQEPVPSRTTILLVNQPLGF